MTDRIKYLLGSIDGLNWIAIVTLVFFFVLFIAIVYVTYSKRKSFNDYMANLPLEEGENNQQSDF